MVLLSFCLHRSTHRGKPSCSWFWKSESCLWAREWKETVFQIKSSPWSFENGTQYSPKALCWFFCFCFFFLLGRTFNTNAGHSWPTCHFGWVSRGRSRHYPLLKVDTGKSRQLDFAEITGLTRAALGAHKTSLARERGLVARFWAVKLISFLHPPSSSFWAHDWHSYDLLWKRWYLMTYHCCIYRPCLRHRHGLGLIVHIWPRVNSWEVFFPAGGGRKKNKVIDVKIRRIPIEMCHIYELHIILSLPKWIKIPWKKNPNSFFYFAASWPPGHCCYVLSRWLTAPVRKLRPARGLKAQP